LPKSKADIDVGEESARGLFNLSFNARQSFFYNTGTERLIWAAQTSKSKPNIRIRTFNDD
jgi:hypothetical protein